VKAFEFSLVGLKFKWRKVKKAKAKTEKSLGMANRKRGVYEVSRESFVVGQNAKTFRGDILLPFLIRVRRRDFFFLIPFHTNLYYA
jgi:hypothetical protein